MKQQGMNQMSLISDFTPEQLDMWRAYEEVRAGGEYNMFDHRARIATGLSKAEYTFVMKNFDALKEAANASD